MEKKDNVKITKEMLNEIYKHDYEDSFNLINPYLIDNEKIIWKKF